MGCGKGCVFTAPGHTELPPQSSQEEERVQGAEFHPGASLRSGDCIFSHFSFFYSQLSP